MPRYDHPGVFTTLASDQVPLAAALPADPVGTCRAVQGLVIHLFETGPLHLPPERIADKELRRTSDILGALLRLDPAPLHVSRPPARRIVGTCRDFVTVSCALLRMRGVPARARCGFATYFEPGKGVDHWVLEYRHPSDDRWVRVDAQWVGAGRVAHDDDLVEGQFLTGGEAWLRHREGAIDPKTFGVPGTTDAWGIGEIRGNAVRDLAALMGVETLPWDEWGRLADSYQGKTGPEYDALMDRIAAVCGADDQDAIVRLYESEDLRVPADLTA